MTHDLYWTLRRSALPVIAASIAVSLGVSGCGSDTMGFDTQLKPNQIFANVTLAHHVYNLAAVAPYDTVQLHAVPQFSDGSQVPATVTYSVSDPNVLAVSATGMMTALGVTGDPPAQVYATATYQGITYTDTAWVRVTPTAPAAALNLLSIQPAPGDSVYFSARGTDTTGYKDLSIVLKDINGDTLSGLLVEYSSSDTTKLKVVGPFGVTSDTSPIAMGILPGTATVHAGTYAYGVSKQDSVTMHVGPSITGTVLLSQLNTVNKSQPLLVISPGRLVLGIGGNVLFWNQSLLSYDIVFDDSTLVEPRTFYSAFWDGHPGSGNIHTITPVKIPGFPFPQLPTGNAVRSFTKAGTYRYHSTLHSNIQGVIVVCSQRLGSCPQ